VRSGWNFAARRQSNKTPKNSLKLTAEIIRFLDDKQDQLIQRAAKPEGGLTPQP
jgi:hypothetical protein